MAEYARLRECSRAAVTKAVKRGQIHLVDGMVDVAAADRAWPRTERPPRPPRVVQTSAPPRRQSRRGPHAGAANPTADPAPAPASADRSYWTHRARTEEHRSKMAELEILERLGKLVDVEEVQRAVFETNQAVRERLNEIPDRVARVLVGKDEADIHDTLTQEIRAALQRLSDELRPRPRS